MMEESDVKSVQAFQESMQEVTSTALHCIENMIVQEEHQVHFVRSFGSLWKVTVEKIGPDEIRFLSFFASTMLTFFPQL